MVVTAKPTFMAQGRGFEEHWATGGRVLADWPGLGAGRLFEDRDLQPTADLRAVSAGLLTGHLMVPAAALGGVFPDGAGAVTPVGGLLRG